MEDEPGVARSSCEARNSRSEVSQLEVSGYTLRVSIDSKSFFIDTSLRSSRCLICVSGVGDIAIR